MKKKRLLALCLSVVLILQMGSICGAKEKTVNLNKSKLALSMKTGEKMKLKVNKARSEKVKWKSCNKAVATINSKGLINAKKPGKAKLIVKYDKSRLNVNLVVKKAVKKTNVTQVPTILITPTIEPESPTASSPMVTLVPPTQAPPAVTLVPSTQAPPMTTRTPSTQAPPTTTLVPSTQTPLESMTEPKVTPAPTPEETPELGVTSASEPPLVKEDKYLSLQLDDEIISRDTKVMSATITKCPTQIINVYINGKKLYYYFCGDDTTRIDMQCDFSQCTIGDEIKFEIVFVGEKADDVNIYNNNTTKVFTLAEPSAVTTPTPEDISSPMPQTTPSAPWGTPAPSSLATPWLY